MALNGHFLCPYANNAPARRQAFLTFWLTAWAGPAGCIPRPNLLSNAPLEENRSPVGRPVFKTGEGRQTSLVGSTPTLFRQSGQNFSAHDSALSMSGALVAVAAQTHLFTQ